MTTNSRRTFFIQSLSGVSALTALAMTGAARAQAPGAVSDADPQAMALGYQSDATKIDAKKYPNYAAGRSCSGCVLYQGKGADATGSCAVFGNKLVARTGWCSAWTQKG
jgi:hypothetical protein